MKKIIFLIAAMVGISSFAQAAYIIKIKFTVKPANDTVYLSHYVDGKNVTDSAVLKNGAVTFTPKLSGAELLYLHLKGTRDYQSVFADEGTTLITANEATFKNAEVKAGKSQELYAMWSANWREITADAGILYRKLDSASQGGKVKEPEEIRAFVDAGFASLDIRLENAVETFVSKDPNSPVAAFIIEDRYVNYPNIPKASKFAEKLGPKAKASSYGKAIAKFLAVQAKTAVGTTPDFTFPDANGKDVKLSDFRGKYVLVDVWASWCGPCRKENPNVRNAYTKFHDKGFEVIGASLDTDKEKWLKAVEADGLAWTQLSDLKGWKSPLVEKFGIMGVPFNFLVDPDGKVIAKDLRGDALIAILEKVIK